MLQSRATDIRDPDEGLELHVCPVHRRDTTITIHTWNLFDIRSSKLCCVSKYWSPTPSSNTDLITTNHNLVYHIIAESVYSPHLLYYFALGINVLLSLG